MQVFLTNGRLQMYRNQEVVHSGETGEGVSFVINGIVKVACVDMKETQDYFLGSGPSPAGPHVSVVLRSLLPLPLYLLVIRNSSRIVLGVFSA